MSVLEIPLAPYPQKMTIELSGVVYSLTFKWNEPMQCWVVDFATPAGVTVLTGIPIVTGVDLVEQFEYLQLGGGVQAVSDTVATDVPTFENLGVSSHVYWTAP